MIEKSKRRCDYFGAKSIIENCKSETGEENPTAKQVVQYMIGDCDRWTGGDYVIYKYSDKSKRSFLNRLNLYWVYPLFIITIPFQFLFFGEIGVNRNSKVGRIVDRLVKFE